MNEVSNLKQRADEQRKAFKEAHGYPAHLIPDIWVGQNVAMNTLGGGSLVLANGTLEAVTPEGFVLSNDVRSDRLYTEGSRRTIGAVRSEPERYRCRFLRPGLERLKKTTPSTSAYPAA